ncbi:enoyl-CoA delta isomerase 2, mitochondrial [Eurytemora carolleeae]|uniref:enoyl-CoA delta isomerase 2, mitochondrial n=1 Tax=Eurytemora carolleeae TaxID=1294199 RepID=UPI000C7692B3|nr:enoyl-CoA delta isomerase 2, mitochondrial [Eurytemora carolleeae]|eukprot:XP_023347058.1 enoyl-CoA delta isomerase 2, mitochondrial-like [Eurytemora affinis]
MSCLSLLQRPLYRVGTVRSLSITSNHDGLEIDQREGLRIIKLNRPKKLNAFNKSMYVGLREELKLAASDSNTVITVVTGAGEYFSSGNDLNMFEKIPQTEDELREMAEESRDMLQKFVESFIQFPKPLVGVVNGPAIGIGGSILGLMDLVYASDRATFSFPFVRLGQGPEGCSSYTFPRLMGPAKAAELLYFGRKVDALEGEHLGLVTRVIPHQELENIWEELVEYSKLPKQSLLNCKELIRGVQQETLAAVNRKECDLLLEQWASPETFKAVQNMFLKKKK